MSGDRVRRLPLSALLSQVLVAFTIECDNEFERQMPHRTSNYGSTAGQGAGPWLVSMAMGVLGWRAPLRRPVTLPHYPMVLHRGGFPDGS